MVSCYANINQIIVMKNILQVFFCFTLFLAPGWLYAQQTVVKGTVKCTDGPLPGVTIIEKGMPANGTTTNPGGEFQLTLKGRSNKLIVRLIGYVQQEVDVQKGEPLDIFLQPSTQGIDEVIVVGFNTKKRITNTGAVSAITGSEIRNVPTANVQNALMGKLPGFVAQQRSGQPGKDASDFFIRGVSSLNADGNKPLIIVDDIEYAYDQLQQINVNEIESITILKDASTTAIYGIKGANGVLVVTTRRGKTGQPQVNLRVESGAQSPVKKPKFLDSYNTALLVNEAYRNDGLPEQFTAEDLELFRNGKDPYGHPNVNWYDALFKAYSLQANTNVDISGGTKAVKYFISAGALTQNGLVKDFSDPRNEVNNNYFFRRYNFRSNLDLQATKTLNLRLDVTTRFGNVNQPHAANVVSEVYNFEKIHPYSAPLMNPNGTYAFAYDTKDKLPTINARLANGGYNRARRTDFNVLLGATQQLNFIADGLSLTGRVAYAGIEQYSRNVFRGDEPPSFHYNPADGSYTLDPRGNYQLSTYAVTGSTDIYSRNINLQAFLTYDKTFGSHHFNSLLLYNKQSYNSMADIPANSRGYSLKLGYDFKQKYLFDFNAAYNGSDRFQAKKRNGLFPAVGLGWAISQEPFFKDNVSFIHLLKLRATYGIVGSDVTSGNRYLFQQTYNNGGNYSFGENNTAAPTIYEGDLGNLDVTWEKAKKTDFGIDINMLKDKLSLTLDYFYEERYDQLIRKGSVPAIIGIGYSPTNVARTSNKGWDGQVNYRDRIGKVDINTSLVFQVFRNKVLFADEAQPAYPWLAKTGQRIDQPFGYTFIGYYTPEDVKKIQENAHDKPATPLGEYPIQAGDLKYRDLNGDGIIDNNDQGPIGKPNVPSTVLGLTLGANYKGFSINVLFQGSFNYSFSVVGTGIETFQSQFQPIHQQRWTPENADKAQFPRLTSNPTTVNSARSYMSDFWLINARYVRLKTVDIGYQLPSRLLPLHLNNARFYLSAYNLFTWTNYKKYQQDPEIASNTAGDAYINQRVLNIGLQVGF
ncbi:TonB-linked outer membrane protein, SusC/RagA family [Chitinophaga terrae (ex Kim and Jung 2007)]|uniref:TonB-linked outer membrane protein, SusC/RagA family n=2 Tax=Chitinophaga terrae (ex Kim and Jung 2007) TaxID=408074 RepID=A0A1H3ZGQ8_9BACT|nr:SusC/RagA family TonB-linked outer membrane protein [Chitinophaga terrae (ex Kim and Jung 2007)]SEA22969.1 TonB-linked outer membrane protein, SusC/RagA family [Chitinophaga terrae (ex Kim and Jung 2007)]